MEILVLIKQVPDDSVEIKLDPATGAPNLKGVEPVVNAFDTYALEMAARLKEANGGSVTVATIGDKGAEAAIRTCLAVGADKEKGYVINDPAFAGADAAAKAVILAKAIKAIEAKNGAPYDIIFCGKEATDYANGIVGVALAAQIGAPVVTDVIAVDPVDGGIVVKQQTDAGYNEIEMATPAVVTIQKPDYDPRYPTIKNKMAARKAAITTITDAEVGAGAVASVTKVVKMYEPPKRQGGVKVQEESVADSVIKAMGIIAEAKVL